MSTKGLSVKCECGNSVPVTAAVAGSIVSCRCGREISVPSLSQLRRAAGRDEYITNAVEVVRKALSTGELPSASCIQCHCTTNRVVQCKVVCESTATKRTTFGDDGDLVSAFGRLFSPIWITKKTVVTEIHGRDTIVEPVFCLCEACQESVGNLRRQKTLYRLLRMVPQYEQLLQEYPKAKISLVSA